MMKRIYLFFLSVSFLITGCDYLDMVPEDDIKTVETVFDSERMLRSGCLVHILQLKI